MIVIDEKLKKAIGKRLKELRKTKHFTLEQLADKMCNEYYIEIDEKSLRRYERGDFLPKIDNLICFTEIYNISLDYIVFGKETSDDNSFTWHDTFKRLNRLVYSMVMIPGKDGSGKIFGELWEDEIKLYLDRLEAFFGSLNYDFENREKRILVSLKDMDKIMEDFDQYDEQLLPTMERMGKLLAAHGEEPETFLDDWISRINKKRKTARK